LRHIYPIALLLIILFNCDNKSVLRTDLQPVYSDFKNALQEKNLYGKVKKIEYNKTTFQNAEIPDKAVLNKIEEYTDFGELEKVQYFDDFGELLQTNIIEYNKDKKFVKSLSISESNNLKILQTVSYDSIQNTRETTIFINDSINTKTTSFFGEDDYPKREIIIEKNDTLEVNYRFILEESGKIKSVYKIEKGNKNSELLYSYEYENNCLVKSTHKNKWTESISEIEWKNGRILKQTNYTISADSVKHINNIMEFDILYNSIGSKDFEDSKLSRELKFEYEFDKHGNWISKNASVKEYSTNSNEFVPVYVDTRKISYWE